MTEVSSIEFYSRSQADAKFAEISELQDVADDVSGLDTRLVAAEGDIDNLETAQGLLSGRMTAAEGRLTTAEGDIDNLEAADVALGGRLTAAEGDIDDLEAALPGKQNVLTAGTGISIVNDVISATGGSGGDGVWGQITGTLSDQTDLMAALNAKQDTLVSGTNIKTYNGQSLLGSGNIQPTGFQITTESGYYTLTDGDNVTLTDMTGFWRLGW